ncbi:MAG TPA: hypothetical protein VMJ32_16010 [Pirellulales bacterium]|nr:hypothetical protein [Pirellulales bacterium]
MTDSQNRLNFADDSQRWLERFADGELNAEQQRQLLLALDAQPDSWRHCALAFIEAQTLRSEFRHLTIADNSVSGSGSTAIVANAKSVLRPLPPLAFRLGWFVLAASVLVAFTLGLAARGWWMSGTLSEQARDLAGTQGPRSTSPATQTQVALVQNPSLPQTPSTGDIANSADSTSTATSKWQALKVTLPTVDGEQSVQVPLLMASADEVQTILAKQEPVLSDSALQTLESTGHEVGQHRAYYPVQLADGTQAVLPMDFVEVRDTGDWQ